MPVYQYVASDRFGKYRRGRIDSADKRTAIDTLRDQGIYVMELREVKMNVWNTELHFGGVRVKRIHLVAFCRQLATLIKAGVGIVEAVRILEKQTESKTLSRTLNEVAASLAAGNQLSAAMAEHPKIFSGLFVNLVRSAEVAGNLDEVFDRLATFLEKEHYTIEKVKSAFTYPIVVGIVGVLVVVFLLIKVIPTFVSTFSQEGMSLPLPTQMVMMVSAFLVNDWYWMLLAIVLAVLGGKLALRYPVIREAIDHWKLRLPVFGTLFKKAAIARMSRTMSTLFAAGVPALQVLQTAAGVVGNIAIEKLILSAADSLRAGQPLSAPLRQNALIPPLVSQMIVIGEETGAVDQMLEKVADFYEKDVEATVDRIKPLIEPVMIVILAGVVAVIIMSTIMPMFKLYQSMGSKF
jgi:type IV pilus assembly protein PilC